MLRKSVKFLWYSFLIGIIVVASLFTGANYGLFGKMPTINEIQNPEADIASEFFAADGKPMGKFFAENRKEIKYEDLSLNLVKALIATEDERFFDHSGIDAEALARTAKTLGKGGGASTITQQLAKLMLKQGRGSIFKRGIDKVKEWIVATKIEANFTKEEIIALYLNYADWGYIYGIHNASMTFYQKPPSDLKLEEAAVLIGMLKSPFNYNPVRKPENAVMRRNTVIGQMVNCKHKYLTEAQATQLKNLPLITNYKRLEEKISAAPYFRVALSQYMEKWCANHENPNDGEKYDLYRAGLKIYTTIDPIMQNHAEDAVEAHIPSMQSKLNSLIGKKTWNGHENTIKKAMRQSERWKNLADDSVPEAQIIASFSIPVKMKIFTWRTETREKDTTLTPIDSIKYLKQMMQASFAAIDPRNGEVKAWVGGINFKWFKYDHVTATRQVGSTFKPILYQLAVKDMGYGPQTEIAGGSIRLNNKTITGGGGAMGHCLAMSKNAAAYRLMKLLGVEKTIEFAKKCGIETTLPPYPSIALGTGEIPLLEMLRAYTMFPNRGTNVEPIFVSRIEDKNGNILEKITPKMAEVVSQQDAYNMVRMMQGVIQVGTAKSLNKYNIPVQKAGKTGTTNDNADGWFIGYTPELLAGTWLGCDETFIKIYAGTRGGSEMAAPMWGRFMASVYNDSRLPYGDIKKFEKPEIFEANPVFADDVYYEQMINNSIKKSGGEYDDEKEFTPKSRREANINPDALNNDIPKETNELIDLSDDAASIPDGQPKNTENPDNPPPPSPTTPKPEEDKKTIPPPPPTKGGGVKNRLKK